MITEHEFNEMVKELSMSGDFKFGYSNLSGTHIGMFIASLFTAYPFSSLMGTSDTSSFEAVQKLHIQFKVKQLNCLNKEDKD